MLIGNISVNGTVNGTVNGPFGMTNWSSNDTKYSLLWTNSSNKNLYYTSNHTGDSNNEYANIELSVSPKNGIIYAGGSSIRNGLYWSTTNSMTFTTAHFARRNEFWFIGNTGTTISAFIPITNLVTTDNLYQVYTIRYVGGKSYSTASKLSIFFSNLNNTYKFYTPYSVFTPAGSQVEYRLGARVSNTDQMGYGFYLTFMPYSASKSDKGVMLQYDYYRTRNN
jgi:hypothetical protein